MPVSGAFYGTGENSSKRSFGESSGSYAGYTSLGFDASKSGVPTRDDENRPYNIIFMPLISY